MIQSLVEGGIHYCGKSVSVVDVGWDIVGGSVVVGWATEIRGGVRVSRYVVTRRSREHSLVDS